MDLDKVCEALSSWMFQGERSLEEKQKLAAVLLWLWDRQEKIEHALGDFHDEPRPVFTSDTTLEHEPISANIDFFKNNPFIGKEDSAMVSDLVNSFLNDELSYSHDEKMKVGAYLRETYETFENLERRLQIMQSRPTWSFSLWSYKLAKRVGLRGRSSAAEK